MKTNYKKIGPYWLIALTVIVSLLLAACGDTNNSGSSDFGNTDSGSTGQGQVAGECDGKGEVTGQILVLTDPKQDLKGVPATLTLTTAGSEPKTFTTEADGTYTIKDLDVNEYELEASVPGGVDGKTIDARKKYLTVDDCYIETVSMVLTAQGIEIPPAPATTQPQVVYVNNQPHYSITHDPFFWLWLFDRPNYYGYSYPPVYTTRIYNTNNVIYVPQSRPAPSNSSYHYTTYSDSNSSSSTTGTKVKAAPAPVSKGSTRLGSSGYSKPPVARTPSSGSSSTSKGSTRNNGSSDSNSSVPKPGIKTPASGSSSNSSSSSAPHPSGNSNSSSSSSSSSSKSSGSSSSSSSSKASHPSSGSSSSKGSTRPKK